MPQIKIVNVATGKETVREMNEKELAQKEIDEAIAKAQIEEEAARVAKLEALGLTADDLRALLS